MYLYTSSTDKTVRVWNYENGKCIQTLAGHTDWVFSVKVPSLRLSVCLFFIFLFFIIFFFFLF